MIKYALGIDISMKSFHVCLSTMDVTQHVKVKASTSFTNNPTGFRALILWIQKHYKQTEIPLSIAMEATGVYYEQCALFLFKAGFNVSVVLPNKAKKYLQATGLKSKNDKIDAQGLARMAAEQALECWKPMNDFFYQLRDMTRHRQSLQELKTAVSNQLHAQEHSASITKIVGKQLKQQIAQIEKQITSINTAIEKHIKSNTEVAKKVENICAIKGVGLHTVAVIIAETNGFELFKNIRQLVSYSGYDVVENQSGKHNGKTKISKKGNSHIRRALHLPAFNVIRYNVKPFISLFNRTLKKHNLKMKSYVAVQKKILTYIFAIWKNNIEFQENYNIQEKEQELTSLLDFEKVEKNSHNIVVATLGKHPVKNHSTLPLC